MPKNHMCKCGAVTYLEHLATYAMFPTHVFKLEDQRTHEEDE